MLTTQCSVVTCCHNPERSSIQEAATAFDAATARASSSTHATVKDAHTTVELLSAGHARRRSNQLNVNGCTPLRMASPARLPQKHCDTSNVIRMLTCHMQALCQQRHHRSMQVQDQSCCASAVAAIQSWQYHAGAAIKTLATTHRGSGSCVCTCAGSWHSCGSHAPATASHCTALHCRGLILISIAPPMLLPAAAAAAAAPSPAAAAALPPLPVANYSARTARTWEARTSRPAHRT